MKTEIGGTFKWSDKAKVYAAAFREGDAVKINGEWHEVKKRKVAGVHPGDTHAALNIPDVTTENNPYNLNYRHVGEVYYEGVAKGFLKSRVDTPYEIATPKDYKVREDDKLVWLGNTDDNHSFGRIYSVFASENGRLVYLNNKDAGRVVDSKKLGGGEWGVIPKWENVKETELIEEEEEMNEKTELVDKVECSRKFKKGDRVRVTGGYYKGWEGSIDRSNEKSSEHSYSVLFVNGRGYRWVEEELLELVEEGEKSSEQQALEYLLTLDKTAIKNFMANEISDWAKELLEQKDYSDLRQTIEILEKLEESE